MRYYIFLFTGLFLALAACQKPPAILPPGRVMNLEALDLNGNPLGTRGVPADNYTYVQIVDTLVDISVLDTTTGVTFTTDNGSFSTGGATYAAKFDQYGKAYAFLKSRAASPAHVLATVGTNYSQNLTIPFQTAWPDSIYLQLPVTASDSPASRISFTARLLLPVGTPSAGQPVGFYAMDTAGNRVGAFNNITPSDSTGTVNAQFWILNPAYKGFITMTAFVVKAPGDSVKGQNRMLITK